MIKGVAVEVVGLAVAWGGWRLLKSLEDPAADTGFAGPLPRAKSLKILGSYLILFLGLMLMMVFGPFFFIAAR